MASFITKTLESVLNWVCLPYTINLSQPLLIWDNKLIWVDWSRQWKAKFSGNLFQILSFLLEPNLCKYLLKFYSNWRKTEINDVWSRQKDVKKIKFSFIWPKKWIFKWYKNILSPKWGFNKKPGTGCLSSECHKKKGKQKVLYVSRRQFISKN